MSGFEIIMIIFNVVTIVISLIGLLIHISDLFSKRK